MGIVTESKVYFSQSVGGVEDFFPSGPPLSFPVLFLQPLFSQERAPTSVAYAENQSMFLDSLVGDAAWRARYCKDRSGNRLPWALHEEDVRATHPYVNVNE